MAAENTSQIEASIIGTLIMYPEMFATASKVLIPSKVFTGHKMFREQAHIWEWMCTIQLTQMAFWDVQIVSAKFGDVSELIRCAEPETLNSQILYLREEYQRRVDVKIYSDALQRLTVDSPYSVSGDVLNMLQDEEPDVQERLRGEDIYSALKSLQTGEVGVDTIWPEYNKTVGGLGKGDILIVAGSPGASKTEEVLREMIHLAKQGKPCAFFSLEMTKESIYHRLFKIESGLSMKVLKNRELNEKTGELELRLSEEDATKLAEAVKVIASIPLFIHDVLEVTNRVPMIIQKIRWHIRNNGLFAYGIDFIQLALSGIDRIDNSGHDTKIFEKVAKALDAVTKSTGLSAIWISKLNRESGSKEPTMANLFGASILESIAAVIMFIHRPLAYAEMEGAETEDGRKYKPFDRKFIIAKNRPQDGVLHSWWQWQEDEKSWNVNELVPNFSAHKMPSVNPDEDLPF